MAIRKLFPAVILIALFGVCSVLPALAYPVSKANNWNNDDSPNPPATQKQSNSDSVKPVQSKKRHVESTPLSPGTHNLAIGVGQVFLTSDFAKFTENAIGMQAQYTYGVSDLFSFEGNFGYSSHSSPDNLNKVSLTHLITGLRTNLIYFDQLVPFFSGGLGFYHPSITLSGQSASAILFGLNLGTGADLIISDNIFFGTRLTFHKPFGSVRVPTSPIMSIEGSMISFIVHAGFSF